MRHFKQQWNRWKAPLKVAVAERPFLLLSGIAVLLAVMGVVELSDDVLEGDTQAVDEWFMQLFRHDDGAPVGPSWLPQASEDLTALGSTSVLLLVFFLAAGFCLVARRRDIFSFLSFSAIGATLLNYGLKNLFARPRPGIVEPLTDVSTFSYPSGHALMSFAIYLSFAAIIAEMAAGFRLRFYIVFTGVFLAMLIGVTRVYLGVHYPSDVLGGWAVGGAWALFCWIAADFMKPRLRRK